MKTSMQLLLGCLLALVLTAPGSAQPQAADVRVSAHLSTGVVKLGAPVEIVVVVEGSLDGKLGKLAPVDGLEIGRPSGPSTERSMRSTGGRVSIQTRATWRIPVKASRAGDFQIEPFDVQVGSDTYRTQPMSLRVREDLAGAELGYMQLEISPTALVVGQPFDVVLSFGWDAGLAAKINHADLSLPWLGELPGAIEIESALPNMGARKVAVGLNGEGQVEVDSLGRQTVDGRDLILYRLTRSYLATSAGGLDFPVSHLEFGSVSSGSIFDAPRVIEMYYKSEPARHLEVASLPEAGRPIEFTGAVGQIAASARVDRREVELGDSIKLEVTWSGDGNLEFFDPPDLAHLPGFEGLRLFGVTELEKSRNQRVSVFDLAPIDASVDEIPAVPLVVFDPQEGRYTSVETRPIPIRVHALEGQGGLAALEEGAPPDDIRDIVTRGFQGGEAGPTGPPPGLASRPGLELLGSGLGVLLLFGFLRPRIRRGLDPAAPLERRRRRALGHLKRNLRRSEGALERQVALCRFLGDRTRSQPARWVGQRRSAELLPELEPELSARLDRALVALEEGAWAPEPGASGQAPSDAELLELAKALCQGGL